MCLLKPTLSWSEFEPAIGFAKRPELTPEGNIFDSN